MKHSFNYVLFFIKFQLFILCRVSAIDDGICKPTQCNGRNTLLANYQKRCRCDLECEMYGDCCIDSPYKPQTSVNNFFECIGVQFIPGGIYIKRNCYQFATLRQYTSRKFCLRSRNYNEQVANYTLKLPVTLLNGVTYGNKYCTVCDNIVSNYTTWYAHFSCETHSTEINITTLSSNSSKFVYNNIFNKWTYVDGNTTETCSFSPIPPPSLRAKGKLRKCFPNMVKSCPESINPEAINYSKQCADYTSVIRDTNGTYYKNEYCALCNNVSSSNLLCRRKQITMTSTSISSTTAMSTLSTQTSAATILQNLSTFSRISPATSSRTSSATSDSNNTNSTTQIREFLHITVKHNCNHLLESLTLMKLVVESKSFATMKRTYIKESNLISSFPVRICKKYQSEESYPELEEPIMIKFIVNFAVVVSFLLTLSHLYDFLFSSLASTSTRTNFAFYSIALMIANFGFLFGDLTDTYCHYLGPITYFGFLTSLFWLSALSFDIACKTWHCVQDTDAFGRNDADNPKKSGTYSLISWIFPAVIAFIMTSEAIIDGEFLYTSIYELCWFPGKQSFVTFFILPLTAAISVNFAFWLFSAYVVRVQRTVVRKLFVEHGINFRFHTALIITSNSMWSAALIGLFNENSFIWLVFGCLNATSGLLVYLSSPVKHASAIKLAAYLDSDCLSSINEKETSK